MKDKEEKVIKEVNSRSVRRKIRTGAVNKKEEELGKTIVLKRKPDVPKLDIPKGDIKKEEKVETKVEEKDTKNKKTVVKKKEEKVKKEKSYSKPTTNKAPYVLFTIASIIYFALTICLVGYTSFKVIATIRANSNNNIDTFVSEKLVKDEMVFDGENETLYNENHIANNKVITYYYIVMGTFIAISFMLAMIFSYISEFFTDRKFENPFRDDSLYLIKKCAYIAVFILCLSTVSVALQKCLTPFKVSTLAIESLFVMSIALICGYIILKRGNEIIKE